MLLARCGKYLHPNIGKVLSTSYTFFAKIQYSKSNSSFIAPQTQQQNGTEYSNWILARSAKFNHDISYLKRKYGRDRYNIHKLTNLDFMCSLVNRQEKYTLNLNQNIVLLAQMNHVCNVLKRDKGVYSQFGKLTNKIMLGIKNPEDFICIGTFINVLVDLGDFNELIWIYVMDSLFARKYDQQYDELFGLYSGLYKYKRNIEQFSQYFEIQKNKIIFNIPIIYRNSLQTIRQYVKYNVYNLKECRILFKSLNNCRINERYFWKSVSEWFNIYIKQQLQQKQFQQYFLVAQSSIERVLFDDGMIRPRSILEQLSQIAFILSEHNFVSHRFITFIENIIIYSIEKGSDLFIKFLDMEKQSRQREDAKLNDHLRVKRSQKQNVKQMQTSYKTIFVNPTEVNSQSIIHILIVLKRSFIDSKVSQNKEDKYDEKKIISIDGRVMNWLVVRLCDSKMQYTPNQLLKIIECKDFLIPMRVDIKTLILEKIKDVREKDCTLQDLKDIFMFLPLMQFQSISYILQHFLNRAHPKDILHLTQLFQRQSMSPEDYQALGEEISLKRETECESAIDRSHLLPKQKNKRWMPYLTDYFISLPQAVNKHENYYSFEQNCYFLYLLLKNQEYWDSKTNYGYLGQMQKLKHSIKIASYSRGFKLQMGTYFYKLMNYVDLVEFFDGG